MRIHVFAEGPATLPMRIKPLMIFLKNFGFSPKIISPNSWGPLAKTKMGSLLSIILTHPMKEYMKTLREMPDIVIIVKASTPQLYLFEKVLRESHVRVIFDLSDALFLPNGRVFGVNVNLYSSFLEDIVRESDFVTTNGHYLLKYVRRFNEKSDMIHDPIDCNLFAPRIKNRGKRITLGWEGNPQAHYENLAMLVKPLEMLSCECALKLKLVSSLGDPKVKKLFKGLETKMEVEYGSKHWLSAKDFAASLSDFDIMLAPIQKTPWYEGKSALRVGIGMAMGIPVVASPVGEQKYVIRHKVNGFLAQNDQDWYSCLKLLIDDYELRRDMGRRGRETAEKELSLRVCGNKLLKIITGSILDLEISQTTTH